MRGHAPSPNPHVQIELRNGVDMVVGTPGRTIDLFEKGGLDLSEVKYLVSAMQAT